MLGRKPDLHITPSNEQGRAWKFTYSLQKKLSLRLFPYKCFSLRVHAQTDRMDRVLKITSLSEQERFKLLGTGDCLGENKTAERRGT